jgi:polysaccharide biosynthesis/export protein
MNLKLSLLTYSLFQTLLISPVLSAPIPTEFQPTVFQPTVPPTETSTSPNPFTIAPSIPLPSSPPSSSNASAFINSLTNPTLSEVIPLKSGDRIRLTVVGFPDMTGEQIILSDGSIQLPMVGPIPIAGLTPGPASTAITTALKPYVRRPQVSIVVLALSPLRVNVIGEVLQPGPRTLEPTKNQSSNFGLPTISPITLSDAVNIAGGITPNADLRNVTIRRTTLQAPRRGSPSDTALVAYRSDVKVDLWQVLQSGDLSADPRLNYGDEILIPTAPISSPEQQALLKSTFAPTKIRVQVAGEVQRSGQVEVAASSGVSQAIAAAGGPTRDAKSRDIILYRISPEGRMESQKFDFGKDSIALRDGDLIVVGQTGSSKVLDFLGKLITPFSPFINLIR